MIRNLLSIVFSFTEILILIEAVLSWVRTGTENEFTLFIHRFTEPLLQPGRKIQEKFLPGLMIDFSPVLVLIVLGILRKILL